MKFSVSIDHSVFKRSNFQERSQFYKHNRALQSSNTMCKKYIFPFLSVSLFSSD